MGVRGEAEQGELSALCVLDAKPGLVAMLKNNARHAVFDTSTDGILAKRLEPCSSAEIWDTLPSAAVLRTHHRDRLYDLRVG